MSTGVVAVALRWTEGDPLTDVLLGLAAALWLALAGWVAVGGLGLALWIGALAWLPLLLRAEARRPRLGYAPARWATVFQLGMSAASGFVIGDALSSEGVRDFARVSVWIAFA